MLELISFPWMDIPATHLIWYNIPVSEINQNKSMDFHL